MSIRPFRLGDLPGVMRLEKDTFGRHAFDAATFLYYAAGDRPGFLVVEMEAEVVGYVVARRSELRRHAGEIPSLALASAWRRRGLGMLLLRKAVEYLSRRGVRVVRLQVAVDNQAAVTLYTAAGFRPLRMLAGYYGRGEDALEMEKTLSPGEREQ